MFSPSAVCRVTMRVFWLMAVTVAVLVTSAAAEPGPLASATIVPGPVDPALVAASRFAHPTIATVPRTTPAKSDIVLPMTPPFEARLPIQVVAGDQDGWGRRSW